MSGLVFPNYILGEDFTQKKSPKFNTFVHAAVSGKESRPSMRAYPLYEWELAYNLLRDDQKKYNLVEFSQDISQWTPSSAGTAVSPLLTANYALAPDGTLTAGRAILNAAAGSTGNISIMGSGVVAPPPGVLCTFSIWMKTNDGTTVNVALQMSYMSGTVVTVTPVWTRFTFQCTGAYSSGNYNPTSGVYLQGNTSTSNYADICIWGAQLEFGGLPTGLVPTYGGAVIASDLKTLYGLVGQLLGQSDTFLYSDPDFNTVSWQPFGVGNGTQTSWQLTAAYTPGGTYWQDYQDGTLAVPSYNTFPIWVSPNFNNIGSGFAGVAELIQNPIGSPRIYIVRYGTPEILNYGSHTNSCLQSQDMTQSSWIKNGSGTGTAPTVTANYAAAPDGTTTASRVQFNKGSGTTVNDISQIYQAVASGAGGAYTSSVWLRSNDGLIHKIALYSDAYNAVANAPPNYVFITVTPTWQRFYVSAQAASSNFYLNPILIGAIGSFGGTDNSADLLMWGAQIESGTYATRYLPTTTSGSSVGAEVSVSNTGLVSILPGYGPPVNGQPLLWSGSFRYRCRFAEDTIDFTEVMNQWWDLKQFKFQEVIL